MSDNVAETLDVRTIIPRERHPLIFNRLEVLQPGSALRLINDHDPAPLRYQLMAEYPEAFDWIPEQQGPEEWIIRIVKRAG
ncbi:MAG: DUF2249 domain-containing protein [Thermogemmatispora sp.]|uniref:DUF2249 domain-containing protein n=1 Tax=Thermogemmatispora sp. TaxID=1968838 RepID=UPI0019E1E733|nr:DUF2249 domain-containing protein [Thermogemmatispora sp.]MBE3566617.1 DUF2249 domain-containing protein [Thermogemmatispora sp.]